ncbi:hypothetical protein LTR84_002910 [Exophiala bonariae]|uniref:Aldehyde dehydrogenase domain-containing protein n=1 Tax=Exophiala bonariae TaxID=1690606 RepID=A0AAV9N9B4_9EURO|nr:hypothetical protein LTR84_002910 [Exophiala bonariae]
MPHVQLSRSGGVSLYLRTRGDTTKSNKDDSSAQFPSKESYSLQHPFFKKDMASYVNKKPETRLFIDGEFVKPKTEKVFDIYNPASEELAATVYEAGAEDVDVAVQAAKAAFDGWEGLGALGRTGILLKLADAIESNAEELDYLDAICMGKPISDCKKCCS